MLTLWGALVLAFFVVASLSRSQMDDATATIDGMTISTNAETQEALNTNFAPVPEPEKPSEPPIDAAKLPVADKKPRHDPRARVEEATGQAAQAKRERDEARAERDTFKARIDALEARANAPRPPEPVAEKKETVQAEHARYRAMPGFPKLTEFQGDDAFEDWLVAKDLFIADRRYDERRHSENQQIAAQRNEQSEAERRTTFQSKIGATPEERQAFIETIDPRLASIPRLSALPADEKASFGNFLVEQIYRSEAPKELLTHFTAHPDDVQRLSTLHPMQVIREMGKLEAQLTQAAASTTTGTAPAPPMSKARPPITPVKGPSQSPALDDDSDEMPVEEFFRRGNAREARKRMA